MMGHVQFQRTQSDAFFDALATEVHYDHDGDDGRKLPPRESRFILIGTNGR